VPAHWKDGDSILCGRYSPLSEDEIVEVRSIIREISLKLAKDELGDIHESKREIAPTDRSPVVTSSSGGLAFELASFGFERWDGKGVIINARSETIKEKAMFKNHVQSGRCAVPASGYFEWKAGEGKKKKAKHLIKDRHGNLLFMAGLYRDGKDGREFVIITKEPVGDVAEIHDRMPVILHSDKIEAWLSGKMPVEELALMDYECMGEPCGAVGTGDNPVEQLSLFDLPL